MLEPYFDHSNVSCVLVSPCGHFGYVGRVSGNIDVYNLQSCMYRGTFYAANDFNAAKYNNNDSNINESGHTQPIRGLHINLFNNVLISASQDGTIKFWSIVSKICKFTLNVNEPISMTVYSRRSNIIAIATDKLNVRLFDAANGNEIRRFPVHSSQVTDMCLTSGYYLLPFFFFFF